MDIEIFATFAGSCLLIFVMARFCTMKIDNFKEKSSGITCTISELLRELFNYYMIKLWHMKGLQIQIQSCST